MGKGLCYRCEKNIAGKYKDISFTYLEMTVRIFKDGMTCENCAKEVWIEEFENNAKKFIVVVYGGGPMADWPRYRDFFTEGRFSDQKEKFHHILINLGILSLRPQGNWEIVADGPIGLNPRAYMSYLYFVNEKDARQFARLEFANTLYRWEIHHIDRAITKEEVLRKKT